MPLVGQRRNVDERLYPVMREMMEKSSYRRANNAADVTKDLDYEERELFKSPYDQSINVVYDGVTYEVVEVPFFRHIDEWIEKHPEALVQS